MAALPPSLKKESPRALFPVPGFAGIRNLITDGDCRSYAPEVKERMERDGALRQPASLRRLGAVRMERPIGKRCQWDGLLGPARGRFPGCGKAGPLRLPGVPEGDPSLVPDGKSERGSAPALRKDARDQREKCVFVLTKGMSLVGHWPTRLDHIGFAPLRSVWGFARPCLPETGKTNRHKSVQRLRGFLRPRELRVPNQAPALKGMAPSAMVCRARSLTAEE